VGRLREAFSTFADEEKLHLFENIDVLDREGLLKVAEEIKTGVGDVDVLVHTVGGYISGEPVYELSYDSWRRMMDLNVHSFINTCAVFVPNMINKGGGKIISIGSKSALHGSANAGAYSAAKGALLRLTESMATELKHQNIQVNCIIPSMFDTPKNRQSMPDADYSKWVKPKKIADVILFLASSASHPISGASIPVFG